MSSSTPARFARVTAEEARREGGRVVGVLSSRLRRSFYNPVFRQLTGLEVVAGLETGLENDAQMQAVMHCTPSTKATLDVWAPELGAMSLGNLGTTMKDVKAKMGVEVTTDLVSVSSAHFIGSSRFLVSAVAGAMGWAGGISAIFNTYNGRRRRNREAIQDPRLALQYTCDAFQVPSSLPPPAPPLLSPNGGFYKVYIYIRRNPPSRVSRTPLGEARGERV